MFCKGVWRFYVKRLYLEFSCHGDRLNVVRYVERFKSGRAVNLIFFYCKTGSHGATHVSYVYSVHASGNNCNKEKLEK